MTRRTAISLSIPMLARGASTTFDAKFGSALEAAAAIRNRRISSLALLKLVFERIDRFQPRLNAFVYQMREEALVKRPPRGRGHSARRSAPAAVRWSTRGREGELRRRRQALHMGIPL